MSEKWEELRTLKILDKIEEWIKRLEDAGIFEKIKEIENKKIETLKRLMEKIDG